MADEQITVAFETKILASEVVVGWVIRPVGVARNYITVEAIEEHVIDPLLGTTLAFLHNGQWSYFDADDMLELVVQVDI